MIYTNTFARTRIDSNRSMKIGQKRWFWWNLYRIRTHFSTHLPSFFTPFSNLYLCVDFFVWFGQLYWINFYIPTSISIPCLMHMACLHVIRSEWRLNLPCTFACLVFNKLKKIIMNKLNRTLQLQSRQWGDITYSWITRYIKFRNILTYS